MTEPFSRLDPSIRAVAKELGIVRETSVQTDAIPGILSGENTLLISPTGSGKTEAALLPIFQRILNDRKRGGIRAIYVTPLRALNRDLRGRIEFWGSRLGITVEVRHGDTPQNERRRQSLRPPEILITTPETLQVLLIGSRLRKGLANCEWVVVDEIHHLASDRRGAQLSIGLERLERVVGEDHVLQRIGLSATVGNKEEVARFLSGTIRPAKIVDASSITKIVSYRTEMPEPSEDDRKKATEIFASPQTVSRLVRMAELIQGHESTLVFVNSRTVAEFLAARLGSFGVKAGVHHGSLPREERERSEHDFKTRRIPALICTSTLELGIDIGSVDLVIQYMSPRQVNSLIQRVGRSGHSLSRSSEGVTLSVSAEDSLESLAVSKEAIKQNLEPVAIHDCALDVLAHQVAGLLLEHRELHLKEILDIAHASYPYRNLTEDALKSVVKYMETLGYLRFGEPDYITIRASKCRNYYLENLSMIPDERRYNVIDLTTQQKVGILGEEFIMLHAKVGVHFIIKGRVWQIESLQSDNVYVTPIQDPSASVPGWDGELLPIPEKVARSVGFERRLLENQLSLGKEKLLEVSKDKWNADRNARMRIIEEVERQLNDYSLPTDRRIVVEKYDNYLIIHTTAGDRINLTLGELFEEILLRKGLVRHWWNDGYRIMIELTTNEFDEKEIASLLLDFNSGTKGFLKAVIRKHFPFGYYMKFVAERFGALRRGLMLSGESLRELVVKFRFTPIYDETLREALLLKVDEEGALSFLKDCKSGAIGVESCNSLEHPSPMGMYIVSRYGEMQENFDAETSLNSIESMRAAISKEVISLLCFKCSALTEFVSVLSLEEFPKCQSCGSSLLAPIFYGVRFAQSVLQKKMIEKTTPLTAQESDILTRARRAADLVLSYGKLGVIAQCVYGIGPQTASKVLSRMHVNEEDFYKDLLEAKLSFIRTRQYWN